MSTHPLSWQQVQTNLTADFNFNHLVEPNFLALQHRLKSAINIFCHHSQLNNSQTNNYQPKFMLIKSAESHLRFSLFEHYFNETLKNSNKGYAYHVKNNKITLSNAKSKHDNFTANTSCIASILSSHELLFGRIKKVDDKITQLQPGLVHQANGGILVLGLRSLLSQPDLFNKLKMMLYNQHFNWQLIDDQLSESIPSMPLSLKIVLIGDRISMADLQDDDRHLFNHAIYSEFEDELEIENSQQLYDWAQNVIYLAKTEHLPKIKHDAFNELIKIGTEYTEDQCTLPISPDWVLDLIGLASFYDNNAITAQSIIQATEKKKWQQSYIADKFKNAIFNGQININTQGEKIGQINALTVIEYPGYPCEIGEPNRLSCIIHYGDGELIDIERKTDLAGSIHSKAMMIIHAFFASEFSLTSQLPFNASLVFEQSYNEIDGDSASLAAICALISVLSAQAIDQQIAVTGSIDQFGQVQVVGGINEKITSFYEICKYQGFTGHQGVIIPAHNQRNLCLNDEIKTSIKNNQFNIWTVNSVNDAAYLLMKMPYRDKSKLDLFNLVQTRIQMLLNNEKKTSSWLGKWFK